jgi:peptide/nickel transport system permease protein
MKEALQHTRYIVSGNLATAFAALAVTLLIILALLAPFLLPHDPLATNVVNALHPPSRQNWFGTDQLGRDLFSRVIAATRLDLAIAFSAVILAWMVGSTIGAAVGFWGGWADQIVSGLVDVLMAFPLFVLAMAFVAGLGNTIENVVYATALINLPFYIRTARAEVGLRSKAGYIAAARMAGSTSTELVFRFLLPNVMPILTVQISLNLGWAILNAAGLSFIGLGVRPPAPEWGLMVAEGATFILTGQWWLVLFPALFLVLAVFSFNLLGDGLRDILDPRRRT